MIINEDHMVRIEGRELISNLTKASGLGTFLTCMRNDLDNVNIEIRDISA